MDTDLDPNDEHYPTYQDEFMIMHISFIVLAFAEFFLFSVLSVGATCKYLPIFTSQSIAILLAFMLGYLVQAALFLKIRKHVGPKTINKQFNQTYDVYIRTVSVVHWLMYLLFYIIVFKIQIIYLQFRGSKWRVIVRTQNQMILFVCSYVTLMIPFFGIAMFMDDEHNEKYKYLYCLGSVIATQNFLLFFNFLR